MLSSFRRFYQLRRVLFGIVSRDMRARYAGSTLGLVWSFLYPLLQFALYWFVFSAVLRVKPDLAHPGTPFSVWLIAGLLPWLCFVEVVGRSPSAIFEQAGLVKKTVFPSELLPLSHLVVAGINHLISLTFLLVLMAIFGRAPNIQMLWIFPFFFSLSLLALGLAWVLSAINVFFRDVGQVLGLLLQIWFYLTPIVYPVSLAPSRAQLWMSLNPLFHVVQGYRFALLGEGVPSGMGGVYLSVSGLLCFLIGGAVFRQLKSDFADVL